MTIKQEQLPPSPQVLKAIRTGFDAITRHIGLVLFPLGIDLLIWFAPHLRIKHFIEQFIEYIGSIQTLSSPELEEMMRVSQEIWQIIAERFNILIAIRSYPVGVFSFMTSIMPVETPLGEPVFVELPSLGIALLVGIFLTVGGVILGGVYFSSVAQAALDDEVKWINLFRNLPWVSSQALILMLIWLALFIGIMAFGSCLIFGIALFSPALSQMALLLYGAMISWILFPLFFSAHSIFLDKEKAWKSLLKGAQLTSVTFLKTSLFILLIILLVQGMNALWQVPPENSWLMLLSVFGHAFISTGALAASFVYYNDIAQWAQKMRELQKELVEENKTVA